MPKPHRQITKPLRHIAQKYLQQNKPHHALACYQQILTYVPHHTHTLLQIAALYEQLSQLDQANSIYQTILQSHPNHLKALKNLGINYAIAGNYSQAKDVLLKAQQIAPDDATNLNNLANVYKRLGQTDQAITTYLQALTFSPDDANLRYNLGALFQSQDKINEAITQYQAALSSNPQDPDIHNNLGLALTQLDEFDQAIEHFQSAHSLDPDATSTMTHLFNQLRSLGRIQEANQIQTKLTQSLNQELKRQLTPSITPFLSLMIDSKPTTNLKIAQAWSHHFITSTKTLKQKLNFSYPKQAPKLKIGYLSNGFRDFPTGHNFTAVLESHRHQHLEVFAFSYGQDDYSPYRQRIRNSVDHFIDISDLSDPQAATQINQLGIHILVDLKGYTNHHRQEILSLKPAPIAINYLGYPGTTGAPYIDYVIADPIVLPPQHYHHFQEKVISLPICYRTTDNQIGLPPRQLSKEVFHLPPDKFIFASFNHPYKLNSDLLQTWTQILHQTPNSILWQYIKHQPAINHLKAYFQSQGIDPERIIPATNIEKSHHLDRLRYADLALDSFPINGHTTTTDNLLVSLPTLTLLGCHFASRVSASSLIHSHIPELTTHSPAQYLHQAINLYSHPKLLKRIRAKLAHLTPKSLVTHPQLLAQYLQTVYQTVWDLYQNQQHPFPIHIAPNHHD